MYSVTDVLSLHKTGFPIQKSPDQSLFSSSPKLIAASHVFHRLLTPRHPPFALNSLATKQLAQSCWTFNCTFVLTSKLSKSIIWMIFSAQPKTRCHLTPCIVLVEVNGIEPMTSCVQGRRSPSWATPPKNTRTDSSQSRWWAWMELNHRPHAYQACALTELSYRPLIRAWLTPASEDDRAYHSYFHVREHNLISQN